MKHITGAKGSVADFKTPSQTPANVLQMVSLALTCLSVRENRLQRQ